MIAKIQAWFATAKLALIIGFCLGAGWIAFIGIPWFQILPSYLDLRIDLAGYADLEEQAVETIEDAEELRAEENTASVEAVKGERAGRDAEVQRLIASYEAQIARLSEERSHDQTVCPVRRIVVPGELSVPSAEELRAPDPG